MKRSNFDVPVALFLFKRKETTVKIVQRIAEVKPQKVYLLADYGRDEAEVKLVQDCRNAVEEAIDWECEIVKNYAQENRGVYANIGEGAKWVLSQERRAIFLEDDNLPEVSFFYYCKELLEKYENDQKVLWICGTNYLGKYKAKNDASYMFTQHLLPCGWASWSDKFLKVYDGEMNSFFDEGVKGKLYENYQDKRLFKYQYRLFEKTMYKLKNNRKMCSWDYQMAYSIRLNGLYGISPKYNQIKNIGVDSFSEHGGTSLNKIMTKRFCGMSSYLLEVPLKHPSEVKVDDVYEKRIGNIILPPWYQRMQMFLGDIIKLFLRIDKDESLVLYLKKKRSK